MRLRATLILTMLMGFVPSARGDAEPPSLRVALAPLAEAGPWKRRLVWTSDAAQEVVLDRRLLSLRVVPAEGRAQECRHPDAPARTPEGRVRALGAGERVEEWIDLRAYCWDRALDLLEAGEATLELRYGWRRASVRRWVTRSDGARVGGVAGENLAWSPPPAPAVASAEGQGEARVDVSLRATTTRYAPVLTVQLRGEDVRVYPRRDLFRFRVRGPLGEVECQPRRQPIVPIREFYRRLGTWRTTLSAGWACPEGTFSVPGVYEVVPLVDLVYDGERHGLDTVTGTFEGHAVPLRRTGGAYVEQVPDDLLGVLAAGESP
ncbi:MAG: hypothetical protein AAGH15_20215 [Myxococcota bacterium]